jgi:hypothetical protein
MEKRPTHRRTEPVIRKFNLKSKVELEKSFGQLHDTLRVVEEIRIMLVPSIKLC